MRDNWHLEEDCNRDIALRGVDAGEDGLAREVGAVGHCCTDRGKGGTHAAAKPDL